MLRLYGEATPSIEVAGMSRLAKKIYAGTVDAVGG